MITILCRNGSIKVDSGETVVLNFGDYTGLTGSNFELFEKALGSFKLDPADSIAVAEHGKEICGIYDGYGDLGESLCDEFADIPDWITPFIDYDGVRRSECENNADAWLVLPSGKIAHLI